MLFRSINTENPKYVDTVTSLITAVRGVTKDLMDIHGKGSNEKENPKQSIQPTVTINNFAKEKDEILTVLESLPDKKTEDDNNDVVDVEVTKS
mgnify:FL=1